MLGSHDETSQVLLADGQVIFFVGELTFSSHLTRLQMKKTNKQKEQQNTHNSSEKERKAEEHTKFKGIFVSVG